MPSQKRPIEAVDDGPSHIVTPLLARIRNMWQFANLCQWIYIFGKAAKIDESIDIEEIEAACLQQDSTLLDDIALALLKLVSSHRGLTHDIFDDQARKQYSARSSDCNPFGDADAPRRFADFDIFAKIKVLQQLTQWVMLHPERIRNKMEEQKDAEQTNWRIEPYGWDSHDRTYYVLDDNRVYRLSEPPPSHSSRRTTKSKTSRAGHRSSKRRRVTVAADSQTDSQDAGMSENDEGTGIDNEGLGGMTWECVAVTLEDVRDLLEILKSRDENEKILRRQLEIHLVPILEKQEEAQKRKELQRERELLNLTKMANAKRSSRIATKMEQQQLEEKARAERQQLEEAEATERRQERMRLKMEGERDTRVASREERLKEREVRRLRHEEQLEQLSSDTTNTPSCAGRMSERHLRAEIEKNKQALEDLEQQEEAWVFDCLCGMHGQVDDGTHSVACERCNVWQHSKCLGISEAVADRPDFQFICASCRRQREDASAIPKTPIKLKLHHAGSPTALHQSSKKTITVGGKSPHGAVSLPGQIDVQTNDATTQFSPKQESSVHIVEDSEEPVTAIDSSEIRPPSRQTNIFATKSPIDHVTATESSLWTTDNDRASDKMLGVDADFTRHPAGHEIVSEQAVVDTPMQPCYDQAAESLQSRPQTSCTASHITYNTEIFPINSNPVQLK